MVLHEEKLVISMATCSIKTSQICLAPLPLNCQVQGGGGVQGAVLFLQHGTVGSEKGKESF